MACPEMSVLRKMPEFKALQEAYADRHYQDTRLAEALELCREFYGKDNTWWPDTPAKKAQFTRFMNHYMTLAAVSRTDSRVTREDLAKMYSSLYVIYTPEKLEQRTRMLASYFQRIVDELEKKEIRLAEKQSRTPLSRQEIIKGFYDETRSESYNRKHNGFEKIMARVMDRLNTDVESMLSEYKEAHPEASTEKLAHARKVFQYRAKERKLIKQNAQQLAALAAVTIGENEGFIVNSRNMQISFEEFDEERELNAIQQTSGEKNGDGDYEEGSKGERFADFRLLKLMNSLSPKAKRLLSRIKKVDSSGKVLTDDLGVPLFVGGRQAAVTLRRELANSTPETLIDDLTNAAQNYPWINGLLKELEEHPEYRQTIYGAFKNAESTFIYVTIEDGQYVPHVANTRAAGKSLTREAGNNLRAGYILDEEKSVYTGFGSLKSEEHIKSLSDRLKHMSELAEAIKLADVVDGGKETNSYREKKNREARKFIQDELKYGNITQEEADRRLRELDKYSAGGIQAIETFLADNPNFCKELAGFCRGIGYDVTADDIKKMATQTMTKKNFGFLVGRNHRKDRLGRNKLSQLIGFVSGVYDRAIEMHKYVRNGGMAAESLTGQYLYNTSEKGSLNLFNQITSALALAKYTDMEERVNVEGKSLSTRNNVNILHQIVDILTNKQGKDEDAYQEDLKQEFLQYEGMALGYGKDMRATGLISLLQNDSSFRDRFKVYDMASFNHVEYESLSRAQKLCNGIVMYFRPAGFQEPGHLIELPIQGDYSTAYNFITGSPFGLGELLMELRDKNHEGDYMSESSLLEALVDEVLIELERIEAIERRSCKTIKDKDGNDVPNPYYDPNRAVLDVREREGAKFQVFSEFNSNGFRERYTSFSDKGPDEARQFVRNEVAEQMKKIINADVKTLEDAGVFTNPLMNSVYDGNKTLKFYTKDGKFSSLNEEAQAALSEYFINTFYTRQQATKIFTGGLEQFEGLIDYEKRNMYTHATHSSLDTMAVWKGQRVGKDSQNVAYMRDDVTQSAVLEEIDAMLKALKDKGIITPRQYVTMRDAYKKIKTTDGQGWRTLKSFREVMIMTDQWDDAHEEAYDRIVKGRPRKSDIDLFMQNIKPVTTGYEHIDAAAGNNQKPVKLTVLHKYSESVLLPVALAEYCLQMKAAPLAAMANAAAEHGDIDLFIFHSGVKIGAHSMIQPFAKWGDLTEEERKERGYNGQDLNERILKDAESIKDYMVKSLRSNKWAVHNIPYKYYGIAASTPPHAADDRIAWAAQAEKVAWANIRSGDKITIDGEEWDAEQARKVFYEIKTAEIVNQYNELARLFTDTDELEEMLQTELAQKSYTSKELPMVLTALKEGRFALPLFSPNVEHPIQELFASVIKKRLTKQKVKGANILQVTSHGMDMELSPFEDDGFPKCEVKFKRDEKGNLILNYDGSPVLEYFEFYLPLTDTRLKQFADENGNIGPERLQQLVKDGVIPESILNFICYRTPSDAEHSVIPGRIKGFLANLGGAAIRGPKEIMVTTGHDNDGDKLRCQFQDFNVVETGDVNEAALRRDFKAAKERQNEEIARYILETEKNATGKEPDMTDYTFEQFKKAMLRDDNWTRNKYIVKSAHVEEIDPDYVKAVLSGDRKAFQGNSRARANAKVQLLFSQLTSREGAKRVFIPGGCDESSVAAKTFHIIRMSHNAEMKKIIADAIVKLDTKKKADGTEVQKTSPIEAYQITSNSRSLYENLIRRSDGQVTRILRALGGSDSPFTMTHAADAYDYIMGGASMISVYAMFNAAMQMLQRANIRYIPKTSGKGKEYKVSLFGNTFGENKMFDVLNHEKQLASLGLARLLNAAVDNNKNPILGYLNQSEKLARMTFFMFANGMTEEEIHLLMNQPVIIELNQRMKARESQGLRSDAIQLIKELLEDAPQSIAQTYDKGLDEGMAAYGEMASLEELGKLEKEDFLDGIDVPYSGIKNNQDIDFLERQIQTLFLFIHLNSSAETLGDFVKLSRPDSARSAIGTTIASIVAKKIALDEFRKKMGNPKTEKEIPYYDAKLGFSGMRDILAIRDVADGLNTDYVMSALGDTVPEIVALNSLMVDSSLTLFKTYFPTAKNSWVETAKNIAGLYRYKTIKDKLIEHIGNEMILYKLLANKKFVRGNSQEEQRMILYGDKAAGVDSVPMRVKKLQKRIGDARLTKDSTAPNVIHDVAAEALVDNIFLKNLSADSPENSTDNVPRLQFRLNGPAAEGTADMIRGSWNELLESDDAEIRSLAIDLFKYNMYTNGFSYGMYEFSHFAPFSVLIQVPGYIDALYDVLYKEEWNETDEENFKHQYIMNHWGDDKLVPATAEKNLSFTDAADGSKDLWVTDKTKPNKLKALSETEYVVLYSGEKGTIQTLYRVERAPQGTGALFILKKAPKLGVRTRSQQVTLQYNPNIPYTEIQPVMPGNTSCWGQLDELNYSGESNYEAPDEGFPEGYVEGLVQDKSTPRMTGYKIGDNFMARFGMTRKAEELEKVEEKAEAADKKNDDIPSAPPVPPAPTIEDMPGEEDGALVEGEPSDKPLRNLWAEQMGLTRVDKSDKKMYHIVQRDENGNWKTEVVPNTPANVREARRQRVFVQLNARLREILRDKGISVGVLTNAEARMALGGVTDFDTATVTAEGLLEMIRIAEGFRGEEALPEEFAHIALEMLGHDNPLVKRLLAALEGNEEALEEAFEGMYEEYKKAYGDDRDKLVLEAAGKLVAKQLFREQEIQSSPVRRLVRRIVDAIKELLRKFRKDDIQNAIFDAYDISSQIARDLLSGKIADKLDLEKVTQSGQFYKATEKLSDKEDILSKLLKTELKRLSIFKKRLAYVGKKKQPASLKNTEQMIKKLEKAIENHKVEDAILSYMHNSLEFLKKTEETLDEALAAGRKASVVCKRLNLLRDTIYSFSQSLEDIRQAVIDKEIQDDSGLMEARALVAEVLNNLYIKYETHAREYFEHMLASVYGEHGKTVTIGKDKGRVITIHEMATKADHDISMASRWMNSLADCDDYVLKAIDDVAREAKIRGRRRADKIKAELEVAVADLIRETSSRNTSFMFEMKRWNLEEDGREDDGKLHKTGLYISEEASKHLTAGQKKFYDRIMKIKKQVDKYLPDSLVSSDGRKIVMLRKYTMDRFLEAEGAKGKGLAAWEGLKNRVLDMSDDIDYENKDVAVDFENNKVDNLPVKFVMKGKNETYDDMTDDVATSIMAYAGMASEYNEVNGIINQLENARYMASEREVGQKAGNRTLRERISFADNDEYAERGFTKPFTVKQARTRMQEALNDYFQMHLYDKLRVDEGTIGNTRIDKRKVVDFVNGVVSLSQMAINLPQRIANVSTGLTQVMIETAGHGIFNGKDVAWASGIWTKMTADRLAQTGKTESDNKLSLFNEYFDIHQTNGQRSEEYSKGAMSRIFNQNLLYAGLTIGEDYLASVTALATARNYKMKDKNGNETNLWDAMEVQYLDPQHKKGAFITVKSGYTKADGSVFTDQDAIKFQKAVIGLNFELQGIYNRDDKSAMQSYALGALLIMYRKWIAPALKRRYAGVQYNLLKDDYEEGYYRTLFRLIGDSARDAKDQVTEEKSATALLNLIADIKAFASAIQINYDKLTDYEKSNIKRACTELGIVSGLWVTTTLAMKYPPEDDDDRSQFLTWWDQTVLAQALRLRTEIGSQAPTPMFVGEALKILRSPFAAIEPIQNSLNIFQLFVPSNYWTEIKSGRWAGHTKAYKYFRDLPVISMFKKIDNFIDPSYSMRYYANDFN